MKKNRPRVVARTWVAHWHYSPRDLTLGLNWEDEITGHGTHEGHRVIGVNRDIYFSIPLLKLHVIRFSLIRPAVSPKELMDMLNDTLRQAGVSANITFQQPPGSIEALEQQLQEWRKEQQSQPQQSEDSEACSEQTEPKFKPPEEWLKDQPY